MAAAILDGKSRENLVSLVEKSCLFPVKPADIEAAMELLTEAGHLKFEDGIARFEGGSIRTKWDFDSEQIKAHHRANLALTMEAVKWPIDQRFLSSVTIACDDEFTQTMIADIRSLCVDILERSNQKFLSSSDAAKVVTMQLALFPYFKFSE